MNNNEWQENAYDVPVRRTVYEILQLKPIKLELGGGSRPVGGYINVDIKDLPEVDFVADVSTLEEFPDGCIDAILARDVIQCFHRDEAVSVLRRWYRKMRRNSRLVLHVPDMAQLFALYNSNKICSCWDASTKSAQHTCMQCQGKAQMNHDKFQTYLYGRNRENDMHKSAYDLQDMHKLVERAGFTVMETMTKELRFVIVAKKVVKTK